MQLYGLVPGLQRLVCLLPLHVIDFLQLSSVKGAGLGDGIAFTIVVRHLIRSFSGRRLGDCSIGYFVLLIISSSQARWGLPSSIRLQRPVCWELKFRWENITLNEYCTSFTRLENRFHPRPLLSDCGENRGAAYSYSDPHDAKSSYSRQTLIISRNPISISMTTRISLGIQVQINI